MDEEIEYVDDTMEYVEILFNNIEDLTVPDLEFVDNVKIEIEEPYHDK